MSINRPSGSIAPIVADQGSINIGDVVAIALRGKWLIVAVTLVMTALGAAYAFTAESWYRADVLLKLAENKSPQGLSSQLGGLGGLASLAGLSVGTNNAAEPIAVLSSRELTEDFIREQNLLPILFADKWDAAAKRWKVTGPKQIDLRDGFRYFDKKIRKVIEDKKTNLVVLSIDWKDPVMAARWANLLVDKLNEVMRQRALAEAQNNVDYLKKQISASNLVPLQQSIADLLETELQKLMLANVSKEFAFKILDHAQVPKWRYSPQRSLIIAGAAVFGVISSLIWLIAVDAFRRDKAARQARGYATQLPRA